MKQLSIILFLFSSLAALFASCHQTPENASNLTVKIDRLKNKLDSAYVPGIGELMNGIIQPHHYKLWLAGEHKNWKLAEYERHMLSGGFKRIVKYHKADPVSGAVPMIYSEMDAIENAIKQKDAVAFKNHFVLLTNVCNTCHQATKVEFNVITVPSEKSFGNQQF